MKHVKAILLGILAGISIGIGGLINFTCIAADHKILGNCLFGVGLLMVCSFGFFLYTGKIGYVFENKKPYILTLLEMYVGNIIGALGMGYLLRLTGLASNEILMEKSRGIAEAKVMRFASGDPGQSWYSLLIMSFFCGILVFIAVDMFKKETVPGAIRVLVLLGAVAAFVISGFEHCVANMFYFGFTNVFDKFAGGGILSLLIATIGNSLGAWFIWSILHFAKKN